MRKLWYYFRYVLAARRGIDDPVRQYYCRTQCRYCLRPNKFRVIREDGYSQWTCRVHLAAELVAAGDAISHVESDEIIAVLKKSKGP